MYTKNFEADTMELALKDIKNELGPDAIILKTTMNKGLKGALSKGKKIQITAAVSEKSYSDKLRVDNVLSADQKQKFYQAGSSAVSKQINNFTSNSYDGLGLNKKPSLVNTKQNSLDDFLEKQNTKESKADLLDLGQIVKAEEKLSETKRVTSSSINIDADLEEKLRVLERKLEMVSSMTVQGKGAEDDLFSHTRKKLLSYGINHNLSRALIDKAMFELRNEESLSHGKVLDFIYEEMANMISTSSVFKSKKDKRKKQVSIIVSNGYSGQTSICEKLASQHDADLIKFIEENDKNNDFTDSFLDCDVKKISTLREVFALFEEQKTENSNIIIDFSIKNGDLLDLKKLKNGLLNYCDEVQVILSLSSIHSEEYNKKEIQKFRTYLDGLVFNYLDVCSSFASIFNTHVESQLPLCAFGTGTQVPTDVENASVERLLGGIIAV